MVAGLIVKKVLPAFADRIEKPITVVATVLLAVVLFAFVGASLPTLWQLSEMPTLAIIVGFVIAGLAIGHLMAGPDHERQGVLAIATASRHPGIAIALASANAPNEHYGAPVLLYLLLGAIVAIPYINWQKARAVVPA
jgi:BASS family bile acid:Na+ symporter